MNIPGIALINTTLYGQTRVRHLASISLIAACLTLAACSSTPTRADRDTTGQFDGSWVAQVLTAKSPQLVHNWQLQCTDLSREMPLTISDGEVSLVLDNNTYTSYISAKGKFNILIDAGKTSASSSSDGGLSNPNVRVSIAGNLGKEPTKGVFTVGLAEVGFAGCKSAVDYRRG